MKKSLITFTTLIFTVMFSSTSFGEWKEVDVNMVGTFYVDFERIKKHDGYVYYWNLFDYLKPTEYGDLSSKVYLQGDCKLFRFMYLSYSFHKEPMGGGIANNLSSPPDKWEYPLPNSTGERVLKKVCEYAN